MKKKINLYKAYQQQLISKRAVGAGLKMFSFILAIGVIIAAMGLRLTLDRDAITKDNATLSANIAAWNQNEKYEKVKQNQEAMKTLATLQSALDQTKSVLDKKEHFSEAFIQALYDVRPEGVTIRFLQFTKPTLSIQVSYNHQANLDMYVRKLKKIENVKAISSERVVQKEGVFETEITIILRGTN